MTVIVYDGVRRLLAANGGDRRWGAVAGVLNRARPDDPRHTRSEGDFLTYRVDSAAGLAAGPGGRGLRAHHLYRDVLLILTGVVTLSSAPRRELSLVEPYSDLNDTEILCGETSPTVLTVGMVACPGLDDAWRVEPCDAVVCLVRLTELAPAPRPLNGEGGH